MHFLPEQDVYKRQALNFGHTLGHAIEKLKQFSMPHGLCVALGALAAMRLCVNRGMVSEADTEAYRGALRAFDLPQTVSSLKEDDVLAATKSDKKMEAGIIKFILLNGVGHAYIDRTVTEDEMRQALHEIMR